MKPIKIAPEVDNMPPPIDEINGNGIPETLEARIGLGQRIGRVMFERFADILNEKGFTPYKEAMMDSFEQIHDALPEGFIRNIHGLGRPIAKLNANILQGVFRVEDFGFSLIRTVLSDLQPEMAPLLRAIPDHPQERLHVLETKTSTYITLTYLEGVKNNIAFARKTAGKGKEFIKSVVDRFSVPKLSETPIAA